MEQKKQTDPMEEAYKQLDGEPAADAVSKAAKGEQPETDYEAREDEQEEKTARFEGIKGTEIDAAYSQLFEALAVITRNR